MLQRVLLTFVFLLLSSGLMRMLATAYADAYTVNKGGSTTSADTVLAGPAQSTAPATCTPNTTWIDSSTTAPGVNICNADGVSYTSLSASTIASLQQTFNVNNEIINAICGTNPLIVGDSIRGTGIELCADPTLGPQIRAFPSGDLLFVIGGTSYRWGITDHTGAPLITVDDTGTTTLNGVTSGAAASGRVVCMNPTTKQVYLSSTTTDCSN